MDVTWSVCLLCWSYRLCDILTRSRIRQGRLSSANGVKLLSLSVIYLLIIPLERWLLLAVVFVIMFNTDCWCLRLFLYIMLAVPWQFFHFYLSLIVVRTVCGVLIAYFGIIFVHSSELEKLWFCYGLAASCWCLLDLYAMLLTACRSLGYKHYLAQLDLPSCVHWLHAVA